MTYTNTMANMCESLQAYSNCEKKMHFLALAPKQFETAQQEQLLLHM